LAARRIGDDHFFDGDERGELCQQSELKAELRDRLAQVCARVALLHSVEILAHQIVDARTRPQG